MSALYQDLYAVWRGWFLFLPNFPDPWYTTRFICQTCSDLGQVTSMCSSAQLKIMEDNVSIEILLNYISESVNAGLHFHCILCTCISMFIYNDICTVCIIVQLHVCILHWFSSIVTEMSHTKQTSLVLGPMFVSTIPLTTPLQINTFISDMVTCGMMGRQL